MSNAKNYLTTIIGILTAVALPLIQFLTHTAITWPIVLMSVSALSYAYFANNEVNWPAKTVNILTNICGGLFSIALALQPVVAQGKIDPMAILAAVVAGVIAWMTAKDDKLKAITDFDTQAGVSIKR